jgi:prophage DNA circulation protein
VPLAVVSVAVQFPANPTSEMSADEKTISKPNRTMEQSDESGHEVETELEEKDKKFLDDAMKTILDPDSIIVKKDDTEVFKVKLDELEKGNITLDAFMEEMDKLSLDVCMMSQQALWSYVTDVNNEIRKNKMVLKYLFNSKIL